MSKRTTARGADTPFGLTFRQASASFEAPLSAFGFEPVPASVEAMYGSQYFVAGPRYVAISATVHPYDAPLHASVVLGEGATTMPESDWNGIGLWQLLEQTAPEARAQGAGLYALNDLEGLTATMERMLRDVLAYAQDFLRGDLRTFRRVRAQVVRTREPYMIHSPDSTGTYVSRPDPESSALKERFGRDDSVKDLRTPPNER